MKNRLFRFDHLWRKKGFKCIAGVDEVGRGPWAGPVVAAAVVLNPEYRWDRLNDSKKVPPDTREVLHDLISRDSFSYAVAVVEPTVVDDLNILQASFAAMRCALSQLKIAPDLVLVDGSRAIPEYQTSQVAVVKGDGKSASIAAASILAKVTRDRLMVAAHKKYPHYDFANNKGYGTVSHQKALRRYGPCEIHRRTYAPVIEAASPSLPLESSGCSSK